MKISLYATDSTPSLSDKLIGTESTSNDETKNYLLSDIAALFAGAAEFTSVLVAPSYVAQAPSSLDTALQVTFGSAQGTVSDPVMLDSAGTITFNETGLYLINGYGSVERQGASGGVATFLFRFLVDGVQAGSVKAFHIDTTDVSTPYEITFPLNITTPGTVCTFQVMRDSANSGVNAGGLYPHITSVWGTVPSTEVNIWKLS